MDGAAGGAGQDPDAPHPAQQAPGEELPVALLQQAVDQVHLAAEDLEEGDDEEDDDSEASGEDEEDEDEEDGEGVDVKEDVPDPSDPANKGIKLYGCEHYRRRAMIVAPCCDRPFWCRHCHNAACNDNEVDPKRRHVLDRKAVREVVCGLCGLRQEKARSCSGCGVAFGRYTCLLCSFFDDDLTKECFHCQDCGICRVGGRHNFFHCRTCNCCYALSLRDSHVCIENSMHANCPVCCEFLFDSIKPINIMPCGHTIHQECLRSLADHSTYTCPVCMKSIMNTSAMERVWESMDQAVQQTPMPTEYAGMRVNILCNDCSTRSAAPFHVLGHKCGQCGSYNTRRV
ncbi:hypothetical protein HYH03_007617 [Edaphochlamys debaryana]|uniref:Uncharacterized protein n=1 Tax=Edaphochlamys debaryana TaxID=47281 RepID=A0A836BZS6_9CHLO|nr:hypothetical protein HYH03_007617 [Edaphochlamys debaryana]|eukprot:KAG2494262.1 hypothetical protein HYH03_007617 [Edaphochlamys debaryana]